MEHGRPCDPGCLAAVCFAWFAPVPCLAVTCSWWPVSFPGFEKTAVRPMLLGHAVIEGSVPFENVKASRPTSSACYPSAEVPRPVMSPLQVEMVSNGQIKISP